MERQKKMKIFDWSTVHELAECKQERTRERVRAGESIERVFEQSSSVERVEVEEFTRNNNEYEDEEDEDEDENEDEDKDESKDDDVSKFKCAE